MCAQGVGTQRWKTLAPLGRRRVTVSKKPRGRGRASSTSPNRHGGWGWGRSQTQIQRNQLVECWPSMFKAVGFSIPSTVHISHGGDLSPWEVEARRSVALIHSQFESSLGHRRPCLNTTTQSHEMGTHLLSGTALENL